MNIVRSTKLIVLAGIVGATLSAVALPTKVLAWHPEGKIIKYVANETTGGSSVDANSAGQAVTAKPGDILRYTITVKNTAQPAGNGHNDLAFVEITDTLPAGVELVANPAQRTIKETIPGIIEPGKSVTKEYKVKVTSTLDGAALKNTACFTGDSTVKDNKQEGCDDAYAKVKVEKQPPVEEPKEEPKEEAPVEEVPAELPSTGPGAILGSAAGIGAVGYAFSHYRRSRKALRDTIKR